MPEEYIQPPCFYDTIAGSAEKIVIVETKIDDLLSSLKEANEKLDKLLGQK
jgi:hypothetical protein